MKLELDFYLRNDVISISRELIGNYLFTSIGGEVTGGRILETEAYRGPDDRASHAYNNRRTKRTEVMFHKGGICYVYLCYGIHNLLNIVTNQKDIPHAILIRAIEPCDGIPTMLKRRKKTKIDKTVASGPGSVAQALGVSRKLNGVSLLQNTIWIEKGTPLSNIQATSRIGVDYAGEDALLPWRFYAG
ncbi:MAG: DNA-3-methyladenine glycosylase [Chlamydiales bacterium]